MLPVYISMQCYNLLILAVNTTNVYKYNKSNINCLYLFYSSLLHISFRFLDYRQAVTTNILSLFKYAHFDPSNKDYLCNVPIKRTLHMQSE
jgi:hypothetical protein